MIELYNDILHISTIEELRTILESDAYCYHAFRGATPENLQQLNSGFLNRSFDWNHEYDIRSDEYLSGTCGIGIYEHYSDSRIRHLFNDVKRLYSAAHGTNTVLLIAGDDMVYGEDDNEVILSNDNNGAAVLAIINSLY